MDGPPEPPVPYSEQDVYSVPPPEYSDNALSLARRTSFPTQSQDMEEMEELDEPERDEEAVIMQARVAAATAEGRNPLEMNDQVRRGSISSASLRRPSFSDQVAPFGLASPTGATFVAQMERLPGVGGGTVMSMDNRSRIRAHSESHSTFHDAMMEVSVDVEEIGESHDGHAGDVSVDGHAMSIRGVSVDGHTVDEAFQVEVSAAEGVGLDSEVETEERPRSSASVTTAEDHSLRATPIQASTGLPHSTSTRSLPSLPNPDQDEVVGLQPPHSANDAIRSLSRPSSNVVPHPSEPPPEGTFLSVASGPLVGLGVRDGSRDERGSRHNSFLSLFRRSQHTASLPPPPLPLMDTPSSPTSSSFHARSQSSPSPLPSPRPMGRSSSLLRGRRSPAPPRDVDQRSCSSRPPSGVDPTPPVSPSTSQPNGVQSTPNGARRNSVQYNQRPNHNASQTPLQSKKSTAAPTSQIRRSEYTIPAQLQPQPSIVRMDLTLHSLTPNISLSRWAQPLCGAILDEKYLLIGTASSLDFLPILSGRKSLHFGLQLTGLKAGEGKREKDVREMRPIGLIKKCRFRQIEILSERSNILLAIAGKNDHIRVYNLDVIRAQITKRMKALEEKTGFDFEAELNSLPRNNKGKGKADMTVQPSITSTLLDTAPSAPIHPTEPSSSADTPLSQSTSTVPETSQDLSQRRASNDYSNLSAVAAGKRRADRRTSASFAGMDITSTVPIGGGSALSPSPSFLQPTPRGSKRNSLSLLTRRRVKSAYGDTLLDDDWENIEDASSIPHAHTGEINPRWGPRKAIAQRDDLSDLRAVAEIADSLPDSLPARSLSTSSSTPRLHPREASTKSRESTSDLLDFLRNGPAINANGIKNGESSTSHRASSTSLRNTDAMNRPGTSQSLRAPSNFLRPSSPQLSDPHDSSPSSLSTPAIPNAHLRRRTMESRPAVALKDRDDGLMDLAKMLRETGPPVRPLPPTPTPNIFSSPTLAKLRKKRQSDASQNSMPSSPPLISKKLGRSPLPTQSPLPPEPEISSLSDKQSVDEKRSRTESKGTSSNEPVTPIVPTSTQLLRNPSTTTTGTSYSSKIDDPVLRSHHPTLVPRDASSEGKTHASLREIANFLNEEPPGSSEPPRSDLPVRTARVRREPRHPTSKDGSHSEGPSSDMTLAEIIREGPPSDFLRPPVERLPNERAPEDGFVPPSRKRWSMLEVFRTNPSAGQPQASTSTGAETQNPNNIENIDALMQRLNEPVTSIPVPPYLAQDEEDTPNVKPRVFEESPEPPSQNPPPELDPLFASAALTNYVKLARTKGARLIRAIETKKRTYLAVLCGDNGERVELFTGSKSVSLSLNRTFVLPETPRTIEFQLQGDDLIDIYLLYEESIFALEPATIRVREVGVGRNERRAARREREREARETASMTGQHPTEVPPDTAEPSLNFASSIPPRNDTHRRSGTVERPPLPDPSPNGSENTPSENPQPQQPENDRPISPQQIEENMPLGAKSPNPYTTFQQLAFLPPVPPSILATPYVIPPTYETVVDATPALPPKDGMDGSKTPPNLEQKQRLLSPVSLLSNPTAQAQGPPGLFFVTRAKQITAIVDAEGRSIIRKPVFWQSEQVESLSSDHRPSSDVITRVEMLISDSKKTVLIGIGPNDIQAVPVEGSSLDFPFGSAVSILPPLLTKRGFKVTDNFDGLRDVVFLGKATATNQVFWAERKNNTTCLYSIATTHY